MENPNNKLNKGNNPDFSNNYPKYNNANYGNKQNIRRNPSNTKFGYYQKKSLRKWGIIILIAVAIYWYFFAPIYKNPDVDPTSEWYVNDIYMSKQYYYNNLLNSEEKIVYKQLFSELNSMKDEITINIASKDTFQKVYDALLLDHPEMINIDSSEHPKIEQNSLTFSVKYLTKSKFFLRINERRVLRIVAKIVKETKGMTDYEKEKYIYEWLGKRINYGDAVNSKTGTASAYDVLTVSAKKTDSAYGKAAQLLLSGVGVNSLAIESDFQSTFNIVKLDGEYYYMDASSADKTEENLLGNISYIGLNGNDSTINFEIKYRYILPVVSGTKYNYYSMENKYLTYSDATFYDIKSIIDRQEEFEKVEICFTNPDEARKGIFGRLSELNLENEIFASKDISTINTGVLMLKKIQTSY